MTSLFNLCALCHIEQPKYRCPACDTRTCSLICSKKHRDQANCPGSSLDPAKFISSEKLKSDSRFLNKDYDFLQSLDRRVSLGKSDLTKTISKFNARQQISKFRNSKNSKKSVIRNGVTVINLPLGMHRAMVNKSGWNKKRNNFYWTIEWMLKTPDINEWKSKVSRHQESLTLKEAVMSVLSTEKIMTESFKVYLKGINSPANKVSLIHLDCDQSVAHNLTGKSVIEFPTIYVCTDELPSGYSVLEDGLRVPESSGDSDGDSSDDSDSDSSDSDDSGSEESEEDHDERPEESTIEHIKAEY